MPRPQDYTETNLLLAVLNEDEKEADDLLSVMTLTELRYLYAALREAANRTQAKIMQRLKELADREKRDAA